MSAGPEALYALSRAVLGALAGAGLAAVVARIIRPLFDTPSGGVGFVTVNGYPKGWDYAVIALLIGGSFIGAYLFGRPPSGNASESPASVSRSAIWITAGVVFVLMLFVHDHPYAHMDPFHEGEHLTPAWLFSQGERPFGDVFLLHGLGTDGGLDSLAGGRALATRRLQTVLDAATLALLVPIAAMVTATTWGMVSAVIASLCGVAAFWLPVFPYFRLAPVLLAALGLLLYARSGRAGPLLLAFASGTLGVLWSLDTGTYALAGTAAAFLLLPRRLADGRDEGGEGFWSSLWPAPSALPPGFIPAAMPVGRVIALALVALALPFAVLLAVRADIPRFLLDSFVVIPNAIDAVWSLPAPSPFSPAGVRYYLPPILYGLLLAIGWKRRDPRILVVVVLSLFLFRTAAGRVSWSHTRYAVPLLGIAVVAFLLEPLVRRRLWIPAGLLIVSGIVYFEIPQNVAAGTKLLAGWAERQRHEGLVPHPLVPGIFTSEDNAVQVATLKHFVDSLPPGPIFDFTNERALYFMLKRRPASRCFDVPMLSAYPLFTEAMLELQASPPVAVILGGEPTVAVFDGVPNEVRVPELARWIDVSYPNRTEIGRFVVATPR